MIVAALLLSSCGARSELLAPGPPIEGGIAEAGVGADGPLNHRS